MNTYDQSNQANVSTDGKPAKKATPMIAILIGLAVIVGARMIQSHTAVVTLPGGIKSAKIENLKPISAADHSRGNVDAPMKLIEYSDLQCPFCKMFHQSMLSLVPEYVDSGKVQWVYRHFPLISIHENAKDLSVATECGFKLGGHAAFWKMVDGVFSDPEKEFNMAKLPGIAKAAGVNVSEYSACFRAKQTAAVVDADMLDGERIGITGTPYAVIITPKGATYTLTRAYSADELQEIFESVADR